MKVNKRHHSSLTRRTRAIIALCVTLALTLLMGYLGQNGTWLDSRGLNRLLPWLPATDAAQWPQSIPLGLDLKGGVFVEYEATMSEEMQAEGRDFGTLLDSTIAIMAKRLSGKGYPEATVARLGSSGIRVEFPDVENREALLDLISSPARLEFRDEEGNAFMDNRHLKTASVVRDQSNTPVINFTMTSEGGQIFGDMTARSAGKVITIALDGESLMSATVNEPIYGGSVVIGGLSLERTQTVALQLESGVLPLDLRQDRLDTLSATLGIDALDTCVFAALIGILLVMAFLLFRYRILGLMADWALVIYIILLFLFIAAVPGIQLTLPGIAGILLGMGMTVHAMIVLFERVEVEALAGRPMVHAVRVGFENAISAVADANIAGVILALALMICGTGPVQGFAVMLLLSVITGMFCSIVVTRFLLTRAVSVVRKPSLFVGRALTKMNAEAANGEAK